MTKTGPEYLNSPEKRRLDVFGSALLIAPSIGVSGIAVAMMHREIGSLRDAMFRQQRPGKNGEPIVVNKLRTINRELTEGKEMKIYGDLDPRSGSIGKLIRRLSIDELPQLVNVLKGDMSLVGPRPLPETVIDQYEQVSPDIFDEWYDFYKSVRPGITGPSQLMRKDAGGAITDDLRQQSMVLDLEYKESASLAVDLAILAETPLDLAKAAEHDFERSQQLTN